MKALVVEGGAMRGVFASGVLDAFLQKNYQPFDLAIGVSAGASNLVGYLANAQGRSFNVITKLATSQRFYNPKRFIKGGDLVDVKWLVDESMRRYPIEAERLFTNTRLLATTTDIATGLPRYQQLTKQNVNQLLEASCALPIAYRQPPCFAGSCFTDGGVSDSIPVKEAYRQGARDITVVLSHPLSYEMPESRHTWLTNTLLSRQPAIAKALRQRAQNYNAALAFIRFPPADATIRVIAPEEGFKVKRLTMNQSKLHQGYQMGITQGKQHLARLNGTDGLTRENCPFCV
ncbi:patatin family protein [Vibrio vulnificus]|uniref:patatin-like phospholipase family protein n=1 Tax=Vibrio vulnificus TaxID=672 RepID=UPI00215D2808|nr:patatin family protein [Vibrio vulnificus]MCR9701466.1 patatin family protein [Vibrio vulnificus]